MIELKNKIERCDLTFGYFILLWDEFTEKRIVLSQLMATLISITIT